MSTRTFHRTLVLVEVLGEQPFDGDIEDMHKATYDGDCSGRVLMQTSEEVAAPFMAQLLIAQGSDPGFLGLNDDGSDTEEED